MHGRGSDRGMCLDGAFMVLRPATLSLQAWHWLMEARKSLQMNARIQHVARAQLVILPQQATAFYGLMRGLGTSCRLWL